MNKNVKASLVSLAAVFTSALLQSFVMNTFLLPLGLLPGGFNGVAAIISRLAEKFGVTFSVSLGIVLLNLPVAILCYKHVGKKFTEYSLIQIFLSSFFLKVLPCQVLFDDVLLNICLGGFLYGMSDAIALMGNASTGGTDFIALYVSNRIGKSIWQEILIFNCGMLMIFGALFGWEYAGYSILVRFIFTKTVDNFYHRYKQSTLMIFTRKEKELTDAYVTRFRHGISVVEGYGGFSKESISILYTVVSTYEIKDITSFMEGIDPQVIINQLPTERFVGRFYRKPLE